MNVNNKQYAFYILSVTLLLYSSNVELNLGRFNVPAILLAFYFIYTLFNDGNNVVKALKETKFVGIFIILMLIGIYRSNIPQITSSQIFLNIISVSLYYLTTCPILRRLLERNNNQRILNTLLLPFLFFATLNISSYFLGFSRVSIIATDNSKMMGFIGFPDFRRVNFNFVTGVNSYGSINGVFLGIIVLSFFYKIHSRIFSIIAFLIFLVTIFFTDCRGAFGFILVAALVAFFIQKTNKVNLLRLIPYFGIFAPLIFILLLPFLAKTETFAFLARGSNDLATGNSRLTMWQYIFNDLVTNAEVSPFGHGDYGLSKTSAFVPLSEMFKVFKNVIINPQNSILSIVLDYGYFALIAFIAILFTGVKKIRLGWANNPYMLTILTCMLVYLLLIGITEAMIGMYYNGAYILFIYIFCLMSLIPKTTTKNIVFLQTLPEKDSNTPI